MTYPATPEELLSEVQDAYDVALDEIERLNNNILSLTDELEQARLEIGALQSEIAGANEMLGGIH